MTASILVVEDDAIIGRHIFTSLKRLGYGVLAVLATGEEAVDQAIERRPDLVLMDISLAGEIDGIEAAGRIARQTAIPVVFLTAYADPPTLQRAKISDPFGYLLKPFDERILQITIEMALYKHRMERRLVESEELLRTLVNNQGEGVAIFDLQGNFIFTNPTLERITDTEAGGLSGRSVTAPIKNCAQSPSRRPPGSINRASLRASLPSFVTLPNKSKSSKASAKRRPWPKPWVKPPWP
jgi:CheY-like chemotaxis protein